MCSGRGWLYQESSRSSRCSEKMKVKVRVKGKGEENGGAILCSTPSTRRGGRMEERE